MYDSRKDHASVFWRSQRRKEKIYPTGRSRRPNGSQRRRFTGHNPPYYCSQFFGSGGATVGVTVIAAPSVITRNAPWCFVCHTRAPAAW